MIMNIDSALVCILFTTLAASYAWGMRGAVIGGEKGAMLPGAFIGLALAWFAGGTIRENWIISAAAGLMGMTFGGTETYGETIGFVLHRGKDDHYPVRGYTGLAFKGALWFSLYGGFLGVSMSRGVYTSAEIIIFCLLIPVFQQVGYRIFNCPYDRAKNRFPKIYFSKTRREEWGGNVILLLALMIAAVVKADYFTLILITGGFLGGSVGWLVGMKGFELSAFPLRNGKFFFGKLAEKKLIDGWKLMEFTLGAFGGIGLSVAFCLGFGCVENYAKMPLPDASIPESFVLGGAEFEKISAIICTVCIVGILVINAVQFVLNAKGKKIDWFIWDMFERPLYNVIPMALVLLGSVNAARLMSIFMIVFVLIVKNVFDRLDECRYAALWQIAGIAVSAGIFAAALPGKLDSPIILIVVGTVLYILAELFWSIWEIRRKDETVKHLFTSTSFGTVYPCFVLQTVLLIASAAKIFA